MIQCALRCPEKYVAFRSQENPSWILYHTDIGIKHIQIVLAYHECQWTGAVTPQWSYQANAFEGACYMCDTSIPEDIKGVYYIYNFDKIPDILNILKRRLI